MDSLIGKDLGRYHILEQLGEGGMAVVYKAYDSLLDRDVAIKIIRRGAFPPEQLERILKRFEREAKALARLSHPGIVMVHDFGDYEGVPYLVMEYLPGGTLKEKMGKPISWQEAAALLIPVARALHYAHQRSILHRDVKPSNIMITGTGEPMLTDFGIARILDIEETHTLTGTGVGIGTPEYMSPEQGLGRDVDARADVYSLGIVLYELVTGRKPYTADTPMAVIIKHINEPLPPPRQFVPALPEKVERVLLKALAKSPENRYPDMGAFAAALESLSGPSKQSTEHPSTEEMMQDTLEPQFGIFPQRVPKPSTIKKGSSIKRWLPLAGVAGLICIGLAGGAVWLLWKNYNTSVAGHPTLTPVASPFSGTSSFIPSLISSPTLNPSATLNPSPTITLEPTATQTPNRSVGSTQVSPVDNMEMVFVPAGNFTMGDPAEKARQECLNLGIDHPIDFYTDEAPPHTVKLASYYVDKTEVTNAMYALCVSAAACNPPATSSSQTRPDYFGNAQFTNYPVIHVSWFDAKTYCDWAGRRLPTEAEWEKAARSMDERMYPWGNSTPTCAVANYYPLKKDPCKGDTSEVGSYPNSKSPYGALDMAGNVWEWTADWYADNTYTISEKTDPQGPATGTKRIMRGGAWSFLQNVLRATNRHGMEPGYSDDALGFRCVQDFNP